MFEGKALLFRVAVRAPASMEVQMLQRSLVLVATLAAVLAAAPGVLWTDHAGLGFVSTAQAQRPSSVDISIFFDELEPHGRWLSTRRYGYVWVPDNVASDWRPYTDGHWVYTRRYGWLWVSDEPYGWAVYHYGRWGYDDDYGWFWVPGSEWAPAWVSWQYSDEYIGWAALPPSGSGYAFSVSVGAVSIGIGAWRFVPTRYFLEHNIRTHIVVGARNPGLLRTTRRAGSVRVVNNVVVNNVINVRDVERVVKRKVTVNEVTSAEKSGPATESGQRIRAFRPAIAKAPPTGVPKQAAAAERTREQTCSLEGRRKGTWHVRAAAEDRAQGQSRARAKDRAQGRGRATAEDRAQGQSRARAKDRAQGRGRATAEDRAQAQGRARAEDRAQAQGRARAEDRAQAQGRARAEDRAQGQGRAAAEDRAQGQGRAAAEDRAQPQV